MCVVEFPFTALSISTRTALNANWFFAVTKTTAISDNSEKCDIRTGCFKIIDQSTWRDRKSKYELASNLESMQSRSETFRLDEVNDICCFIQPQNS